MVHDFQLRPAAPADYAFCRDLCFELMRPLLEASCGWFPELAERKLAAKFHPDDASIILLDGRPVGFVLVRDRGPHLQLEEIHIRPDCQGQGLGTAVLTRVLPHDRPVRLSVLRSNQAISLYRRLGFTTEEADGIRLHMVRRS